MPDQHHQDDVHQHSLTSPASFWAHQADYLYWHKKPSTILSHHQKQLPASGENHGHWEWFPDGEISTCFNCIDRHVMAGHGDYPAVIYDSPVTGVKRTYSYSDLLAEVETFAGVLREEGVGKGDVILIYMPMIPAAIIGILAVNRLGAIHTVVFGGFAPAALAQRIDASKPVAILTASCGIDGNKPPASYKHFVQEAISLSTHRPKRTIIWQREQLRWHPVDKSLKGGEKNWQSLMRSARERGVKADAVPVKSTEPIYIIYTSGTTGQPKGVLRDSGGHAVGLHMSISYMFGIHGPGDVCLAASDLGWVVGHSYILYGPLLTGAATVLYEGKPIGTPDASAFWRMIEEYSIDIMFTAPTALRAIRRDDPENKHLKRIGARGGLRSLKALFLAGERSEPSIVTLYQELLEKYGARGAHVIDNWWSSESGSPITGIALSPLAGRDRGYIMRESRATSSSKAQDSGDGGAEEVSRSPLAKVKPGSAGKAMPGFDVRVVDDSGKEVKRGVMGNIVLALPLAPTAFRRLWDDEERFFRGYLKRFGGRWVDTGDAGFIDEDGYVHVMSRADDILNVSAHRLSTSSIEQALTCHSLVAEACVVGMPDPLKGHVPFAFITLTTSPHPSGAIPDQKLFAELNKAVRTQIGPIASLGGIIQGQGIIPKTRSGKVLRRTLRELLENATKGELDAKEVQPPATIEDAGMVQNAKKRISEYWALKGHKHGRIEDAPMPGLKAKL